MIDLANLPEVNSLYDHAAGNRLLKDFSAILSSSALSLGFVGRNGGNKFLAIFEDCTQEKLDAFLARVSERVQRHNAKADSIDMEYKAGTALNSEEHLAKITGLIALANNRIYKSS
ncbi:MAG: diguanylate cyclase domain-containing protein [[Clostridium] scindens]